MVVVADGVDGFTPDVLPEDVLPALGEPMLEEPEVPEPPEPEAPIELVLPLPVLPVLPVLLLSVLAVPVLPLEPVLPVVPDMLPPAALVLGEVAPVLLGVVELEELVDVLGVVPV